MLICDNIACARGGVTLFRHLGFCLQEGTFLLVKGANGAGKTTFLEILAGKHAPDEGVVKWKGTPVQDCKELSYEMMHIGHDSDIDDSLSVEENIRRWGQNYGTQTLVNAALTFYDLEPYAQRPASELSVGFRRRLALAKLVIAPCKLWLLDEPTNFFDEDALLLTTSLIETRVKQGGIVIVASHIMSSNVGSHTLELGDFRPL